MTMRKVFDAEQKKLLDLHQRCEWAWRTYCEASVSERRQERITNAAWRRLIDGEQGPQEAGE